MDSDFLDKYLGPDRPEGESGAGSPGGEAAGGPAAAAAPRQPWRTGPSGGAVGAEPEMTWPAGPTDPGLAVEPPATPSAATGRTAADAENDTPPTGFRQPSAPWGGAHHAAETTHEMRRWVAAPQQAAAEAPAEEAPSHETPAREAPARPARPRQGFSGALNQQWQPVADAPQVSYQIRTDELIKTRRESPEIGWRKAVYVGSFHAINLGPSAFERRLREQKALIASNIPGNYQIPMLSIKGGVGKTRTVAGVGTVFGQYRKEPVIAIDANPAYGSLGRFVDPAAVNSMRDWLADTSLNTYPKARSHTGKNRQGLEVLAGNQNVANPLSLDAEVFMDTLKRAQRFYQLALIDCGPEIDHPVIPGVLNDASALVIVATMQAEHAEAAGQTIEWLAARNAHDLLKRTVVVLNDAFHGENKAFVANMTQQFAPYVQSVKVIPWDPHLRDAVTLDFEALRPRTQLAYIELAAELATGFSTAGAPAR
ncbi:MAG: MinD/ParA family protein [Mycobacteriaceae bacterium]|nr:MinD/ParA family protein [Mycobacteriaceae bacterium]MBV9638447.1 MinD/ParA family protein [Mycobacteriaceae bacterium]